MFEMVKRNIKKVIRLGMFLYISIATLVGTLVMFYPFILLGYNGLFAPAPMPVYLPNGFIYSRDSDRNYGVPNAIFDKDRYEKDRKKVVMSDVKDVMWHGKTIYGFRQGLAKEPYYYICAYGEDCSETQHLKEVEFIRMLEQKDLPPYNARKAKTYNQLLWEQSKTDIGKKGG